MDLQILKFLDTYWKIKKNPLSLKLGNKYIHVLIDVRTFAQYYNQGISYFIRHEFNVTYSTNLWWNDNFHGSFKSQLTNKSKSIINNWNCNTLYDPNVVHKSCMHYRFSLQHNGTECFVRIRLAMDYRLIPLPPIMFY